MGTAEELKRLLESIGRASGCSLPQSEERNAVEALTEIGRSMCEDSGIACKTPIEFVLIDSTSFVAEARQPGDKGYVMISWGTILLLGDLFYRILAHPHSFPNIGTPAAESIQPFHQLGVRYDYAEMAKARGHGIGHVRPRDANRVTQAQLLTFRAFHFLVLHELAHIQMGHLSYLKSQGCLALISEFGATPSTPPSAQQNDDTTFLESQAMEMQADWWAAMNTADSQIFATLPEEFFTENFKNSRIADRLAQGAFDWMFAVACLFAVLNDDFDPKRARLRTHPPAVMRVDFIVTHVAGPSPNPPPENLGPHRDQFYAGANLAFRCVKLIGGLTEVDERRITEAFKSAAFPMHAIHIEEASAELAKRLAPFDARIPRPVIA
jgi:hypothetical protein